MSFNKIAQLSDTEINKNPAAKCYMAEFFRRGSFFCLEYDKKKFIAVRC